VTPEFEMGRVAAGVLEHLERRRATASRDEREAAREVELALEPVRAAYVESELPRAYFAALEAELRATLPAAWRAVAAPFTALEARGFGRWRGGDLSARLTYVLVGLALGGLLVWLPFIPIWEKWVPFALAVGGWWLPDALVAWHRRRYGRELGEIVRRLAEAQPALEARVPMNELLPTRGRDS
jgi:hypothetical protein